MNPWSLRYKQPLVSIVLNELKCSHKVETKRYTKRLLGNEKKRKRARKKKHEEQPNDEENELKKKASSQHTGRQDNTAIHRRMRAQSNGVVTSTQSTARMLQ